MILVWLTRPELPFHALKFKRINENVYQYTAKGNLVNGTAVLGLGDIGAMEGKPVMEGKGLLFKVFADVDVFDIEIDEACRGKSTG